MQGHSSSLGHDQERLQGAFQLVRQQLAFLHDEVGEEYRNRNPEEIEKKFVSALAEIIHNENPKKDS